MPLIFQWYPHYTAIFDGSIAFPKACHPVLVRKCLGHGPTTSCSACSASPVAIFGWPFSSYFSSFGNDQIWGFLSGEFQSSWGFHWVLNHNNPKIWGFGECPNCGLNREYDDEANLLPHFSDKTIWGIWESFSTHGISRHARKTNIGWEWNIWAYLGNNHQWRSYEKLWRQWGGPRSAQLLSILENMICSSSRCLRAHRNLGPKGDAQWMKPLAEMCAINGRYDGVHGTNHNCLSDFSLSRHRQVTTWLRGCCAASLLEEHVQVGAWKWSRPFQDLLFEGLGRWRASPKHKPFKIWMSSVSNEKKNVERCNNCMGTSVTVACVHFWDVWHADQARTGMFETLTSHEVLRHL